MELNKTGLLDMNMMDTELSATQSKFCEKCMQRPKMIKRDKQNGWMEKGRCRLCIGNNYFENMRENSQKTIFANLIEPMYLNALLSDFGQKFRSYLEKLQPYDDLLLWGEPGRGKTHAMNAIAIEYLKCKHNVKIIRFSELLGEFRSIYSSKSTATYNQILNKYCSFDILGIDDLGVSVNEQETNFVVEVFTTLLDKRQANEKSTMMTTNKNLSELGRTFDERVESRLKKAIILKIEGPDWRENYGKKNQKNCLFS